MSSAEAIAKVAKSSFEASQLIPASERNAALDAIVRELEAKKNDIISANTEDLQVRHFFRHFLWLIYINILSVIGS